MLILKAVSLGPLHGYGVLLRIQQISTFQEKKTPPPGVGTSQKPDHSTCRLVGQHGNDRETEELACG
jgi:hypothetical protein